LSFDISHNAERLTRDNMRRRCSLFEGYMNVTTFKKVLCKNSDSKCQAF